MKTEIHVRTQKSVGASANRFGGPNVYVAVTLAPDNVPVPYQLKPSVLRKRGIKLIYCGEGYKEHSGPRSMYGQALAKAREVVEQIQKGD